VVVGTWRIWLRSKPMFRRFRRQPTGARSGRSYKSTGVVRSGARDESVDKRSARPGAASRRRSRHRTSRDLCMRLLSRLRRQTTQARCSGLGRQSPSVPGPASRTSREHFFGREREVPSCGRLSIRRARARHHDSSRRALGVGKTALIQNLRQGSRSIPRLCLARGRSFDRETVPFAFDGV
jgi:hypothetical protein